MTEGADTETRRFHLSADWVVSIVVMVIMLVISIFAGPRPQTETVTAASGETSAVTVLPARRWTTTASVGDEKVTVEGAPSTFRESEHFYAFVCQDGRVESVSLASLTRFPSLNAFTVGTKPGTILILLHNACDAEVTLTLTSNPLIP